jgi:hypothetical protein
MLDLYGCGLTWTESIDVLIPFQLQDLVVAQGQPLEEAMPYLINIARQRRDGLAGRIGDDRNDCGLQK